MGRRISATLGLLFFATLAMGQTSIGAFVGLNNSKLVGDAPINGWYFAKPGLNMGLKLDIPLHSTVWLSLQPSYSQEGVKVSFEVPDQDELVDSVQVGLDFFSLPIMVKVLTAKQRFYAIGGLEPGWLLNSYRIIQDTKEEIQADVSDINLALHFGAGYRIPLGLPVLFIELRYSQGMLNLSNDPISKGYIPRVKTSGAKVFFGIEFPLSHPKK